MVFVFGSNKRRCLMQNLYKEKWHGKKNILIKKKNKNIENKS